MHKDTNDVGARLGRMLARPQTHAEYVMPERPHPQAAAVQARLGRLLQAPAR